MAQAGYTPISLYYSTTAAAVPTSGNLANGELAINITDGKLYYKSNAGVVLLLASNATSAPVLSFQTSLSGLTPSTATTGVVTLAGTLGVASGGTGLTTLATGSLSYGAGTSAFSALAIGTAGQILTVNSGATAPQWSTLSGVAVTTFSAGTTGFTPNTATSGAITLAGTLATTNGGTGLTSFTSGGVVYASSTSALATGSALSFDGTNLGLGGTTNTYGSQTTLTLSGSNVSRIDFRSNSTFTGTILSYQGITEGLRLQTEAGYPITFYPANSKAMTLDTAGNLGLGVTPSAWWSGSKVMQLGSGGFVQGRTSTATTVEIGANQFINSSIQRIYTTTGAASSYEQASGSHIWYSAASGTAGNVVSLTQAMTLDVGGNLGVGTTSPTAVGNYSVLQLTGRSTSQGGLIRLETSDGTSGVMRIYAGSTEGVISVESADPLIFNTNATERARIDSSGNLLVGATSTRASAKLDIRSDDSIAVGSNASFYGTIGYSASTGYLSLASEAGGGAGIRCQNGTTTLSIIDLNSLYAYVGVNPSNTGVASARIFNSSAGASTTTLYIGNASITTVSDSRLKENIVDTQRNALELLGQLRVVDHTWNDPSDQCENNRNSRGTWMGLIAQEAQPIIPWLVNKPTADVDENGDPQYWHMDYGYSVPLLVKAIQEQQAIIESLKARLDAANL